MNANGNNRGKGILRLQTEIEASRGWFLHRQFAKMEIPYYVLFGNARQLLDMAIRHNDPSQTSHLWDIRNRAKMQAELNETVRLVHNFVAAAKSLVDHTRSIAEETFEPALFERYCHEVKARFAEDPLSQFVQQLRNYALHCTTPEIVAQFHYSEGDEKSQLVLSVRSLLQWSRWNTFSRAFISSHKTDIPIRSVVDSYCVKADEFRKWLIDLFASEFAVEISHLHQLQERLKELYRQDGLPVDEIVPE